MEGQYQFTQYKEMDYGTFTLRLSVVQFAYEYSIMMHFYDKVLDSYYLKQFNNESLAVEFLTNRIERARKL